MNKTIMKIDGKEFEISDYDLFIKWLIKHDKRITLETIEVCMEQTHKTISRAKYGVIGHATIDKLHNELIKDITIC